VAGPVNVLVVLLDDVGVDQVSAYGWPGAPATPTIDALAARGLRFDHAWAAPSCSPTRAALMSGQYAHRTTIGAVIHENQPAELPLSVVTLPEGLKRAPGGWSAGYVGKWHLSTETSPSGAEHPWLQGFDQFSGSLNNIVGADRSMVNWDRVGFDHQTVRETRFSTDAIVDDALEAAGRLQQPFLLYVAFHAAHQPMMVPPGVDLPDPTLNTLYAANVSYADQQLGRLLDGLGDRLQNTLVLVLGDNGTPDHAKDPDGQVGAKGGFLEGGVNVPFIVAGPPVTARGASSSLVHVVDVFPTLMELAGAPGLDRELDGHSLVPLFTDPTRSVRELVYTELRHPPTGPPWKKVERAASDGTHKLVDTFGEGERWYVSPQGGVEHEVPEREVPADVRRELRRELARHPVGVTRPEGPSAPSRSDR
jgi:arylsulfatase B